MLRNASIVLALAACLLGAQAADLPKPARELTFKNKTKAAAKNSGMRSKTKVAELCLADIEQDLQLFEASGAAFTAQWSVYKCADATATGAPNAGATSIGQYGMACIAPTTYATCTALLTLNTDWHKKSAVSTAALSHWMDLNKYGLNVDPAGLITMIYPVVTGVDGAWGKGSSIKTLTLTDFAGSNNTNYKLALTYKGKGWNPAAF